MTIAAMPATIAIVEACDRVPAGTAPSADAAAARGMDAVADAAERVAVASADRVASRSGTAFGGTISVGSIGPLIVVVAAGGSTVIASRIAAARSSALW